MRSGTPPDPTYLTDSHDKSQRRKGRLPFEVPESVARHTVTVTKPEDILGHVQDDREQRFQLLVRRYISQIQDGCQNPSCATPTCLSYQKRTAKAPLRRYTPLSARTVACFLASENDPEAALCPNQPIMHSEAVIPRRGSRGTEKQSKNSQHLSSRLPHGHPVYNCVDRHALSPSYDGLGEKRDSQKGPYHMPSAVAPHRGFSGAGATDLHTEPSRNEIDSHVSRPDKGTERPNKDPKSFTQSLFDTLPLRMLEWIPLRQRRAPVDSLTSTSLEDSTEEISMPVKIPESRQRLGIQPKNEQESNTLEPHFKLRAISNGHIKEPMRRGSLQQTQRSEKRVEEGKLSAPRFAKEIVLDRKEPDVEDSASNSSSASNLTSRSCPSEPRHIASSAPIAHEKNKQMSLSIVEAANHGLEERRTSFNHQSNSSILKELRSPCHHDEEDGSLPRDENLGSSDPAVSTGEDTKSISGSTKVREEVSSLSHFSLQILLELCDLHSKFRLMRYPDADKAGTNKQHSHQNISDFIKQSVFFVLKDPFRLMESFSTRIREDFDNESAQAVLQIHPGDMVNCFNLLYMIMSPAEILQDLWYAVDHVHIPPPGFRHTSSRHRSKDHKPKTADTKLLASDARRTKERPPLTDDQAAYVCIVGLYALARMAIPLPTDDIERRTAREIICIIRASGEIFPARAFTRVEDGINPSNLIHHILDMTDILADPHALRLIESIVNAVGNRLAYREISRARASKSQLMGSSKKKDVNVLQIMIRHLQDYNVHYHGDSSWDSAWKFHLPMMTLEWLRVILLKEWNGKPLCRRASTFGGVIQMLAAMYESSVSLGLWPHHFYTPLFSEKLDPLEMPVEWLSLHADNKMIHLLSYSFLFPPSILVTYFRALNFAAMSGSFESALVVQRDMRQFGSSHEIPVANTPELINVMRPAMAICLVLTVRRDNVLADAIDQVWRRQRRELMRPLKVRMGVDEGEEGIDHGGVQQEFFRVLFGQALDPAYGMFSTDERTRMSWFQPGSMEPLFKFEVLGLLMSIAVYNSITLPVTFPTALYRKLLGLKVKKLGHITDGWPDLAKGLQALLDWSESDVGDVFMRTYEFSYESFGANVDIDMEKIRRDAPWPPAKQRKGKEKAKMASFELPPSRENSPPRPDRRTNTEDDDLFSSPRSPTSEQQRNSPADAGIKTTDRSMATDGLGTEAALVTNENRGQFVKDYIFWLTDKSVRRQYEAFARGFYTCLDRKALSIFTAEALQSVVEGIQEIDVDGLQRVTKYEDGYEADSEIVTNFWEVVRAFTPEKRRQLLEFVTASDRIPVNGVGSIMFIIQRNGTDDHRLPTSMTCFGRLLLPHYSSKEVLAEKLTKAIENAKGFGVA